MNKKEADTIILACKKYGIRAGIQNFNNDHLIDLDHYEKPIKTFQAAKYIVNALVIEKRYRVNAIKELQPDYGKATPIKNSYWSSRKEKQAKVTRDWGKEKIKEVYEK